jgi:hypothetical protein
MKNNFYKKIYKITLCNFCHSIWEWHNTQHIQKLAIEDLWSLRYCRSRFFTFLFFMQKLSGTSSGTNNKSCRIFHNETKKSEFAFFWFFYDFLRILHKSAKWLYYLRFTFAAGALEGFRFLRICPWSTKNTLETFDSVQCRPQGRRPVRAVEFRRGPAAGSAGDGRGVA